MQGGVAPCRLLKLRQMGTMEYNCKGSFLGWFVGLIVPVQEIFFRPWLHWSAQYIIFLSSPYTISIYVSPSPSNLGRQSCRASCLCMNVVQSSWSSFIKGTQDWDFFWLRFWNLYYFFISYVKILRFYNKQIFDQAIIVEDTISPLSLRLSKSSLA